MKKVLSIIVVLAVVLCSSVGLAETDPAVGMWYFLFDFEKNPEIKANFGDYDSVFCVLAFLENGNIVEMDTYTKDETISPSVASNGKWEKANGKYTYKIIGLGEGSFTIAGDELLLYMQENGINMRLRRVVVFDPYKDYFY